MIICDECKAPATWRHGPGPMARGREHFCEDHVPRGCLCQSEEDGTPIVDDCGRKLPCVDFDWTGPGETASLLASCLSARGAQVSDLLRENEALRTSEANAVAARNRWLVVVQRRVRQHKDNLEMWKEPDGFLLPSEPDPEIRRRIRYDLNVAIEELTRLTEEVGVKL